MNLLNFWNKLFHRKMNYICIEADNNLIHYISGDRMETINWASERICDYYPYARLIDPHKMGIGIAYDRSQLPSRTIILEDMEIEESDCKTIKRILELLQIVRYKVKFSTRVIIAHPSAKIRELMRLVIGANANKWFGIRTGRIMITSGFTCIEYKSGKDEAIK